MMLVVPDSQIPARELGVRAERLVCGLECPLHHVVVSIRLRALQVPMRAVARLGVVQRDAHVARIVVQGTKRFHPCPETQAASLCAEILLLRIAGEVQRKANVGVELHGCSLLLCVQYSIKKRSVNPCYICLQGQNAVDNVSRFVVEFQQGSIAQLCEMALAVLRVLEEVFGDELAHG